MYPQQQGYPQQPGFTAPGYQQPGYGYPQSGYPQGGYPPSGGPHVDLNMGPAGGNPGWGDQSALFAEKSIRQAFVSKVFSILTVQLAFTSVLIGFFVLNEGIKLQFKYSQGWIFLGFGIFFVAYLILICIESARRSFPMNFVLLTALTIGYGLVAAITSCRYDTLTVLIAFIATAVSCFLLAAFAKSTSFDMTNCGTTLCLLSLAHMVVGTILALILVSMGKLHLASLILSVGGAFLASLYLVYDLQLIMGGRKAELSPEEYILGAVMLYTDIIQIFIYMLEIINRISND